MTSLIDELKRLLDELWELRCEGGYDLEVLSLLDELRKKVKFNKSTIHIALRLCDELAYKLSVLLDVLASNLGAEA